ncbi:Mss4-like protein [Stachybotrys elegans]|uniref:Mss4-like protein n=1 Tax=Stachybotrys elegans TaxID=80388 RepID=A0A8K0WMZ0_9HYPO|nr:Mss4-like protein [Stachybotrys elegans]
MPSPQRITVSCHCGAARQDVQTSALDVSLCHCSTCRHTTGLLCTSYLSLPCSNMSLYFCAVCGCHTFRSQFNTSIPGSYADLAGLDWQVATGVITDSSDDGFSLGLGGHLRVEETQDGGLANWISTEARHGDQDSTPISSPNHDLLPASCQCGNVNFFVTRPNADSALPHSGFSDLIIPFHTGSPDIPNPNDVKWWLRENNKYLAGTCACQSCRLVSGFEIQTWAFVPRCNIFFRTKTDSSVGDQAESSGRGQPAVIPLDFNQLLDGVLQSYESSEGVLREFCPGCGATIFWHDKWRPDLIDVSVGLLRAPEGARADTWLEWCAHRVSFDEDAETGRSGWAKTWARGLIDRLASGVKEAHTPQV